MGSYSNQEAFLSDTSPLYTEGIRQFKVINIIIDYIPHPNSLITSKLSQISQEMESMITKLSIYDKGPYISTLYGRMREEAFKDFESLVSEYPEPKRSQYIKQFYQDIDKKYQIFFEENIDLREIYKQNVTNKNFPAVNSSKKVDIEKEREDALLNFTEEYALELLTNDIEALLIDWYILIEKTVDILVKCGLYKIKKGSMYRELYRRIKNQHEDSKKSSWLEKLTPNWNSFIPFPNSSSRNNSPRGNEMPYADAMDGRDIFILVNLATCGEFISKLFKDLKEDFCNKELLVKAKGFLLFAKQNLSSILSNLTEQFEGCFLPQNTKEFQEKLEMLDKCIDELVNFKDLVSVFDDQLSKSRCLFSQEKNWIKVVKIERALSDMQRSKETKNEANRILRSVSLNNCM